MPFWVYVLRSLKDGKLYTGQTQDIEKRLRRHNSGLVPATKNRRPLVLVHEESFKTRSEARGREAYLKTGKGREELRELVQKSYPKVGT